MSTAIELVYAQRARIARQARAEMDAQRQASAAIREAAMAPVAEKGPKGDKPDHEWVGTGLRFEKPDGTWGELVDLRGPKGARGDRGSSVGGGSGIGILADAALPILDTDYLVLQRAGRLYRISVEELKDVFGEGGGLPTGTVTVDGDPVTVDGDYVVVGS